MVISDLSVIEKQNSEMSNVRIVNPARAFKSDVFSAQAMDFIQGSNASSRYNRRQLLNAYMTSVYMYAALKRVANLISKVNVVAEIEDDSGKYVRAPDNVRINQIFQRDGAKILSRMWLNYAIYGQTVVYKTKTREAVRQQERRTPIFNYSDNAVAGLYVLDNTMYTLDERHDMSELEGVYVTRQSYADDTMDQRYLSRPEFVYVTDWNPENPNRGQSIVSVAIHEAIANKAIAQWMSEYFTRGAMPFILVSMDEDPAFMTESDLARFKSRFEKNWQGMGSSLRAVFADRKLNIEQVGISADEVSAPDLNDTALEGIAAAVGLDRKLIVTNDTGSYAEHVQLVKRAWEDTIIPVAEMFLQGFNEDLGLPDDMRLVLDLSNVTELDADRRERADTEISIYESGIQSYNEARTRINMPPLEQFEGYYNYDNVPMHIDSIESLKDVPHSRMLDYVSQLWNDNLIKRSEALQILGKELPQGEIDGYRNDVENRYDFVLQLWGDDLLTRSQVLDAVGKKMPADAGDGYRSQLERGADYGEFILQLWSDNLLTRAQTISLLDNVEIEMPSNAPDGYAEEIGNRMRNIMDYWESDLVTRQEAMRRLDLPVAGERDGFRTEIETELDLEARRKEDAKRNIVDYWSDNLITRESAIEMLGLPQPEGDDYLTGFRDSIDEQLRYKFEADENFNRRIQDFWRDGIMTKQQVLEALDIPMPVDAIDGYQRQVETINEAIAEQRVQEITGEEPSSGGSRFRSLSSVNSSANWKRVMQGETESERAAEEHMISDSAEGEDLHTPYSDNVDVFPEFAISHKASASFDNSGSTIWAGLYIDNHDTIESIKNRLKQQLPDERIEWQVWGTYHITLVYANNPDCTLEDIVVPGETIADEQITITGIGKFQNTDSTVIYLSVDSDSEFVKSLQQDVYDRFSECSDSMSDHSNPDSYTAHITLAYLPTDIVVPDIRVEEFNVRPVSLCLETNNEGNSERANINVE